MFFCSKCLQEQLKHLRSSTKISLVNILLDYQAISLPWAKNVEEII
jgi:hypothetical protein